MEKEIKSLLKNGTAAELSQLKATATEALAKTPEDANAKEIIDAVNAELETRVELEDKKASKPVKVRAKNFVLVNGRPFQKDQEGSITAQEYAALAWNFTKLAMLMLLGLLLFAGTASAQAYKLTTLSSSLMTNKFAANTTTLVLLGPTNSVAKWEDQSVMIRLQCDAACNSNLVMGIVRTMDGTNFETTASATWNIPMNGTTAVWWGTNMLKDYLADWAGWKFASAQNPHATANATNVLVQIGGKPIRFGL